MDQCVLLLNLILLCWFVSCAHAQSSESPPTVFVLQPVGGRPDGRGDTKVLQCLANGSPLPVYRWIKNGQFMTMSNVTETSLLLSGIQLNDAGAYQCVASNQFGALLSSVAPVTVAYMTPFASSNTLVRTVEQGRAWIMDLPIIDSVPVPSIQWYDVTSPVGPGNIIVTESTFQRLHVTLDNRLVVLQTQSSDNGRIYRTTATNDYTRQSSDSSSFKLSVTPPSSSSSDSLLEIVVPPVSTTAIQGDDSSVKLECVANARQLNYLDLRWFKYTSNKPRTAIEPDNIKYALSTYRRVLTIRSPTADDSGIYQCEASYRPSSGGVAEVVVASANLTVFVKPNFVALPPSDLTPDVSTAVVIQCQAIGTPTPSVRWYRNAVPVVVGTGGRYAIQTDSSLRVESVMMADSGVFQCFATNLAGQVNAATWLNVQSFTPRITSSSASSMNAIAGDTVRIKCVAVGAPSPVIRWSRIAADADASSVMLSSSSGHIQVSNTDLLIVSADITDTSIYTCNATNSLGSATATTYLLVTARTRISVPPQNTSAVKGSTATFSCGVTRDLTVSVSWLWYGSGVMLPTDALRQSIGPMGDLTIVAVRNTDIGIYTCLVRSTSGNDSATAYLSVVELPYSPTITLVRLNSDSTTAVDVLWTAGYDGNSPITRYVVQYRVIASNMSLPPGIWQAASSNISASVNAFTVLQLQPATAYQFQVSAVNVVGVGTPSAASGVIEIPQQPPSGPPRGLAASPRSNSSVIIQWRAPDANSWNGQLLGYILRYKLAGYQEMTVLDVRYQDSIIVQLSDLIVFQEYDISVAAFNQKGVGVYSQSVYVRTLEGRPTAPPTNVAAITINSTAVNISWEPPKAQFLNGINQGYRISLIAMVTSDNRTSSVMVAIASDPANMLDVQTMTVGGLRKYTSYSITVTCFTSVGDGPYSTPPVVVRTFDDIPDRVAGIKFVNVTDKSIVVVWSHPLEANGILTNYTLVCSLKTNSTSFSSLLQTVNLSPDTTNFTLTSLSAATLYTVTVSASTRLGSGPPLSADIRSGMTPELPTAPSGLAIADLGSRSAVLRFTPGFDGYAPITQWIIESQQNYQSSSWSTLYSIRSPDTTSVNVINLQPHVTYRLRLIASNLVGRSNASLPTSWFTTSQTAPSSPPAGVTVRAISDTSLRVQWTPLGATQWNGDGAIYSVQWKTRDELDFVAALSVSDRNLNFCTVIGLAPYVWYSVRIAAVNNVGASNYSAVTSERTLESVPSAGPVMVTAIALSSTSIGVSWRPVPVASQNGMILGYKVIYKPTAASDNRTTMIITLSSNNSTSCNITQLFKFVSYTVHVLAFTVVGDGPTSQPAVTILTLEDVPGAPVGAYFPSVSQTSATLTWSPPTQPNGVIVGYRVAYGVSTSASQSYNESLGAAAQEYTVNKLIPTMYYTFTVAARTRLGWGNSVHLEVYTVSNRRAPDPPSYVGVSQTGDRWVLIGWTAGGDGNGPIRNYTIESQKNSEQFARVIGGIVPPTAIFFNISGLDPNTLYAFRVAASNDIGTSNFSAASAVIKTKPAVPDSPPIILAVVAISSTSANITWIPADPSTWNGALTEFGITYRDIDGLTNWQTLSADSGDVSFVITNLAMFTTYEVRMSTVNAVGASRYSPPSTFFMEIGPTGVVRNITGVNETSRSISIAWQPPDESQCNGVIIGYRVFWWISDNSAATTESKFGSSATGNPAKRSVRDSSAYRNTSSSNKTILSVVLPSSQTFLTLYGLLPYTRYSLTLLAFNSAGDGPNLTAPITVRTAEDVPGPTGLLQFVISSPTSVTVVWTAPARPNGIMQLYEVSYYQDSLVNGQSHYVVVQLTPNVTVYTARQLIENMKYVFMVRARTRVDWGEARMGNVTIAPLPGAPGPPGKPVCVDGSTSVLLSWVAGHGGDTAIVGYVVQMRRIGETVWMSHVTTTTPETQAYVSIVALTPAADYQFRVIAMNAHGIGYASEASDSLRTSDVLALLDAPFYQQWWFLVIVALIGVILVILVVFALCASGRRYRARERQEKLTKTIVQLNDLAPPPADDFSPYATRQSLTSLRRCPDSTPFVTSRTPPARSRTGTMSSRAPPRPSPGSVNYNDDSDDDHKSIPDDSSSLSDKNSADSTAESDTENKPRHEDSRMAASRYEDSTFPNHYLNGNVQNSWRRGAGVAVRGAAGPSSLSPSGLDNDDVNSSHYAYALGNRRGQLLLNNTAGSRAPLPGFSSFV